MIFVMHALWYLLTEYIIITGLLCKTMKILKHVDPQSSQQDGTDSYFPINSLLKFNPDGKRAYIYP